MQPLSLLAARSAERNLIERSFNKLKRFRRLATRHDRNALYFSSFVYLAASLLWLLLNCRSDLVRTCWPKNRNACLLEGLNASRKICRVADVLLIAAT